jgi:putative transcriptional regulator
MNSVNLTDNFLIAMPTLEDMYFSHALVYVCEHNENGALGIIVNRPIDMTLAGLFDKIDIKLDAQNLTNLPVYFGGPVQLDRGFVLHRPVGQWQSTLAVNGEVGLTSSRDVLASVGSAGLPSGMPGDIGKLRETDAELLHCRRQTLFRRQIEKDAALCGHRQPRILRQLVFQLPGIPA